MDKRQQQLSQLKAYTDDIDKEVTLLLQNLQWDPKFIIEKNPMVVCKHDANHRLPLHNRDNHEEKCYLTKLGYGKDDAFLPDPADPDSNTLVKLTKDEIAEIFNYAAMVNPTFKRGVGCEGLEPLTAERLQRVYSADERRVIHDAVVNLAPSCHDLADLDLLSSNNEATSQKKSRLEILSELRNMKRRRAKYRVAAKTRNYSDVLRDVIKSQMDSYGEATRTIIKTEYGPNMYVSQSVSNNHSEPTHSIVKVEKVSPKTHSYRHTSDNSREQHRARSRDNRYTDDRRGFHKDNYSSKDRSHNYDESDQSGQSRYHSTNKSHGERHDHKEKGRKDNHSSKERSNRYDDRHRGSRNFYKDSSSRGKRYDDDRNTYHKDQITERSKTGHNTVIKQERVSEESDSDTTYSRDRYDARSNSKDKGYRISKNDNNKYSNNESENHNRRNDNRERYNPDRAFNIKQERITPDGDHRNNREGSRKHHKERSRSKDKSYRKSKTEYKKKHSHKERIRNHDDRRKDVHESSPYTVTNIKQEIISPAYLENSREGSRKRYREGSTSEDINVDDKHKRKKDDHSSSQKNESWVGR